MGLTAKSDRIQTVTLRNSYDLTVVVGKRWIAAIDDRLLMGVHRCSVVCRLYHIYIEKKMGFRN